MVARHISALALLLSCASSPLQASVDPVLAADCWQGSELEALKVQRFKTMLLVSMLNCRDVEPGIAADYNRFVRANRDLIARKQGVVRQFFIRNYGPSAGLHAYSAFETSLGNRYSNADFDYNRCAAMADEARMAGYVSEGGLMDLIHSMPDEDRLAMCRADPRFATARQPEWAPPPPPQAIPAPPVEVAQNEWPDLAPIEPEGPAYAVDPNEVRMAEAAPPPPAPMPERMAEPVQVAAVEAPAPVQVAALDVPKPAAPDRMRAVREAAKALREALAALETEEVASVQ